VNWSGAPRPKALVVTAPGTNRERELAAALRLAGAEPVICRTEALPALLPTAPLVVLAGGFSHADALEAGRRWALDLRSALGDGLRAHVDRGGAVLGICNGFQALVRTGLLPGALGRNADGRFACEWVRLAPGAAPSIWTAEIDHDIDCPVAHGEGRYVADPERPPRIALTYAGANPNGSDLDIAGVTDATGLVLGLMPHPEDHATPAMHPRRRRPAAERAGLGLAIFEAGVRHARAA
jgi:phosphoribosylformylglycinamidine synthase subunit PurQ / glutaminase